MENLHPGLLYKIVVEAVVSVKVTIPSVHGWQQFIQSGAFWQHFCWTGTGASRRNLTRRIFFVRSEKAPEQKKLMFELKTWPFSDKLGVVSGRANKYERPGG